MTRPHALRALILAAVVVFAIHALAWPLSSGRAGGFQLLFYLDFWDEPFELPALLGYPPVAPLVFGSLLEFLGGYATEAFLALCFVATIVFSFRAGAVWGTGTGIALAVLILLHANYASLFHRIDNDVLFATAFAGWLSFAVRNAAVHSVKLYAIHGMMVTLLILIRSTNPPFLGFVLYPLFFGDISWSRRMVHALAFIGTASLLLGSWSLYNVARFGESGTRFSNAAPMMGLMAHRVSIRPENGPASTMLINAVRDEVLTDPRYQSRGIDLEDFFADGSGRAWEALLVLSDRKWGWDAKYRVMRDVALETVRHNPGEFLLAANRTFVHNFILRYELPVQFPPTSDGTASIADSPTEFPPATRSWSDATPDNRYATDGGSSHAPSFDAAYRDLLERSFGYRHGIAGVASVVNRLGRAFVPMIVALAIGVFALPFLGVRAETRPAEAVLALMLAMAIGLMLLVSALTPPTIEYRLPLDPLFLLAAIVGGRAIIRGRRILRSASRSAVP